MLGINGLSNDELIGLPCDSLAEKKKPKGKKNTPPVIQESPTTRNEHSILANSIAEIVNVIFFTIFKCPITNIVAKSDGLYNIEYNGIHIDRDAIMEMLVADSYEEDEKDYDEDDGEDILVRRLIRAFPKTSKEVPSLLTKQKLGEPMTNERSKLQYIADYMSSESISFSKVDALSRKNQLVVMFTKKLEQDDVSCVLTIKDHPVTGLLEIHIAPCKYMELNDGSEIVVPLNLVNFSGMLDRSIAHLNNKSYMTGSCRILNHKINIVYTRLLDISVDCRTEPNGLKYPKHYFQAVRKIDVVSEDKDNTMNYSYESSISDRLLPLCLDDIWKHMVEGVLIQQKRQLDKLFIR